MRRPLLLAASEFEESVSEESRGVDEEEEGVRAGAGAGAGGGEEDVVLLYSAGGVELADMVFLVYLLYIFFWLVLVFVDR